MVRRWGAVRSTCVQVPALPRASFEHLLFLLARRPSISRTTPPAPQVAELIRLFGSGLHALGVQRGDRVALFAEDSSR